MKIILKHTVRLKAGEDWKAPGEIVDVPKAMADDLIANGAAEPYKPKPAADHSPGDSQENGG